MFQKPPRVKPAGRRDGVPLVLGAAPSNPSHVFEVTSEAVPGDGMHTIRAVAHAADRVSGASEKDLLVDVPSGGTDVWQPYVQAGPINGFTGAVLLGNGVAVAGFLEPKQASRTPCRLPRLGGPHRPRARRPGNPAGTGARRTEPLRAQGRRRAPLPRWRRRIPGFLAVVGQLPSTEASAPSTPELREERRRASDRNRKTPTEVIWKSKSKSWSFRNPILVFWKSKPLFKSV